MAECLPQHPGPAIILTQSPAVVGTPVLLAFKVLQAGNIWSVEVRNRRTLALIHTTNLYLSRAGALAEAKLVTAPYITGLLPLP